MYFDVVDKKTGEYPDLEEISKTESWAKSFCYDDFDLFAVTELGELIITDDRGRITYVPPGRFEFVFKPEKRLEKGDKIYEVDSAGNIYESEIKRIVYDTVDGMAFDETAIGKSVFLTKAEAFKKSREVEK